MPRENKHTRSKRAKTKWAFVKKWTVYLQDMNNDLKFGTSSSYWQDCTNLWMVWWANFSSGESTRCRNKTLTDINTVIMSQMQLEPWPQQHILTSAALQHVASRAVKKITPMFNPPAQMHPVTTGPTLGPHLKKCPPNIPEMSFHKCEAWPLTTLCQRLGLLPRCFGQTKAIKIHRAWAQTQSSWVKKMAGHHRTGQNAKSEHISPKQHGGLLSQLLINVL